ncbi:uncharacterized protein LOC134944113 [Pseudophryne corroboree]|uniref:uncharacterized protein LOC134944113 n=1 Tax=Pseudophryne corroboree TaxID=495146 RepID=UPI003081FE7B
MAEGGSRKRTSLTQDEAETSHSQKSHSDASHDEYESPDEGSIHRAPKFTDDETDTLIDQVIHHTCQLFGPEAFNVHQKFKNNTWEEIAKSVSTARDIHRTPESCKKRLRDCKRKTNHKVKCRRKLQKVWEKKLEEHFRMVQDEERPNTGSQELKGAQEKNQKKTHKKQQKNLEEQQSGSFTKISRKVSFSETKTVMTENVPSTADEPSVMPHILTLDNPSMVAEPSMLHHDVTVDHASMLDQPSMLQHTSTVDDTSFVAEPSMLKHSARVDDISMVDQPSMMQEYYSLVHSSTTEETSTVNETSMRQERSTMDDPSTEDGNSTMQNPLMLDKAIESNMVPATQTQDNINEEPVLHSQQSNIDTEDTNQVELNAETAHSSVIGHGLQDQFLDSTNQDMSQTVLGARVKELKTEGYRVIHVSCLKRQIDNRNILSEILQVVHSFKFSKYFVLFCFVLVCSWWGGSDTNMFKIKIEKIYVQTHIPYYSDCT